MFIFNILENGQLEETNAKKAKRLIRTKLSRKPLDKLLRVKNLTLSCIKTYNCNF